MRLPFFSLLLVVMSVVAPSRIKFTRHFFRYFFGLAILGVATGRADVRMPAIFGDHMVLQQDMKIPVWGWADPGETITLSLGANKASATAGADGKWRAYFPAIPTHTDPLTLTVAGNNTLKFSDVLVGDVWVSSGQSNMEFPLKMAHNADAELPRANDSQLRLFLVPRRRALQPLDDILGSTITNDSYYSGGFFGIKDDTRGVWMVCTPQTASFFSAVCYFFGKDLRADLKRPIGLIGSYWGGSPAECWISLPGLKAEPAVGHSINAYQNTLSAFPGGDSDMETQYAAYLEARKKWDQDMSANPGRTDWNAACATWQAAIPQLQAEGKPIPQRPAPPIPEPAAPANGFVPALLFNGMIAPLMPYAIKGVIWYQGESDTNCVSGALEYKTLFSRLITDWREKWGEGDFPFLFVQLANNDPRRMKAGEISPWAVLRESQFKTLDLPHTGMAVAIDLGMATSIHPLDKMDVGHRLALVARRVAYGQEVLDSGPVFESMKIDGTKAHLTFTHASDGLIIGTSPWIEPGAPPVSTELRGFAIAGADKNWVWAAAKLEGNEVVVSSDQVPNPVAVRYAWAMNPECNLYNKAGLPACPFRTDDWN
jgi:sialate O-acetylesterase